MPQLLTNCLWVPHPFDFKGCGFRSNSIHTETIPFGCCVPHVQPLEGAGLNSTPPTSQRSPFTSLRSHDFLIARHRRPHAFSIIRTQRPHPIRTLPSPRMRCRANIRMSVVAQPIRPSRRPFRQRPIPRTQICTTTNVSPRENGVHQVPNQDQHDRPDHIAHTITIKQRRRSPWSRRPPPPSSMFVFQGFSIEESSFRLVEPSMESFVSSSSLRAS